MPQPSGGSVRLSGFAGAAHAILAGPLASPHSRLAGQSQPPARYGTGACRVHAEVNPVSDCVHSEAFALAGRYGFTYVVSCQPYSRKAF